MDLVLEIQGELHAQGMRDSVTLPLGEFGS